MAFYWLKFVGTTSKLNNYNDMLTATTINETRWEMELAVQAISKNFPVEGDSLTALSSSRSNSRKLRREFMVEFEPFSTHLPVSDLIPQNSDTWELFMRDIWPYQIWITRPTTEGRQAPPRWQNEAVFPLTYALLPARCEPEPVEISLVKSDGIDEISMTFTAKKRV